MNNNQNASSPDTIRLDVSNESRSAQLESQNYAQSAKGSTTSKDQDQTTAATENQAIVDKVINKAATIVAEQVVANAKETIQTNLQNIQSQPKSTENPEKNTTSVILFGIAGIFFIILSILYLPLLMISPAFFSLLFGAGSFCILIAMVLNEGKQNVWAAIVTCDNAFYLIWYVLSLIGTFYFTLVVDSKLFSIIFAISQIASLTWMIFAKIPGGHNCLKNTCSSTYDCCKSCCGNCCKNDQEYQQV